MICNGNEILKSIEFYTDTNGNIKTCEAYMGTNCFGFILPKNRLEGILGNGVITKSNNKIIISVIIM